MPKSDKMLVALLVLAVIALLLTGGVTSHAAPTHAAQPARSGGGVRSCVTMQAVSGAFDAAPRQYVTVCVPARAIPAVPAFLDGVPANCDYVRLDVPGPDQVQLQCEFSGRSSGHYAYTASGRRVWEYTACHYYADSGGAYLYCYTVSPLATND